MKLKPSVLVLFGLIPITFIWTSFNLHTWDTYKVIIYDIYGYYLYLPALFIYGDLAQMGFAEQLANKYQSMAGTGVYVLVQLENGTQFDRYTIGLSLIYLPGFLLGHLYAQLSQYPADGLSVPYQAAVQWWSITISMLGLWTLRKVLLNYFSEAISSICLLLIVFGTNYFYYAVMEGAMVHNALFTLYALLLYYFLKWEKVSSKRALWLGFIMGLILLVRPTAILVAIIPLYMILANQRRKLPAYLPGLIPMAILGGLQMAYYQLATGQWLLDPHPDHSFHFTDPQILSGLFSYRKGWLLWTPLMIFSLIGLWSLRREMPNYLVGLILFLIMNIYVLFSWDHWWYGGSFGMRTMVESYALLALPMASFLSLDLIRKWWVPTGLVCLSLVSLNLFQTWQYINQLIPFDWINAKEYWDAFGKINP